MLFEWDENKREKTLRERGIDFIDAAMIWEDASRQERVDNRHSYGEKRVQTIGKVAFGILLVVYTERVREDGQDVIRIISVRKASRKERKEYETRTFHIAAAGGQNG
jgi:uncharacterized DUF497 family protein